ncbi:MAG: hypothetical protein ABJA78_11935 [Ferruginibacter sp.]
MRKLFLLPLALLLFTHITKAQFYKSFLPSPAFSDSLAKVVLDFRFNFKAIQGEKLSSRDNMDIYRSKVSIPGAAHSIIYRSHSVEDTTACFQSVMYSGDNYNEAVKVYRNTFRLVKKSRMRWVDKSAVSFSGELEEPDESIRFTMSFLKPDLIDNAYHDFFAEVEMTSSLEGWEVRLNLHNKRNDMEE